ncbi:MAG TPA: RNA 2',3'-cyclic phosphodiesterase [bacterium]|nr:RNA 2',3'-cyclic phosphodiesterase [bacterium]
MGSPRLFVAVPVTGGVLIPLTALLEGAPPTPAVKWTRTDQLHLTLFFLGPTPEEKIPGLIRSLSELSARYRPFRLSIEGWGAFPDKRSPKVLFADVGGSAGVLEALASDVQRSIGTEQASGEKPAAFKAHVTLGRIRERKEAGPALRYLEREKDRLIGTFPMDGLVLFESVLEPGGARYIKRASFSFPGMDSSQGVV